MHTGFTDILSSRISVRLGAAGGDAGKLAAHCRIGAFRGMKDSVLHDGGYGIINSPAEFDALLDDVAKEWEQNECFACYYTFTARREEITARDLRQFIVPPSHLSIPEVFQFHASANKAHEFFRYHQDRLRSITYEALDRAIDRAVDLLRQRVASRNITVAVLAVSDSISYVTTMLGFLRAGITPLFLSPRNSAIAVDRLLQQAETKYLMVSSDDAMQSLARAAIEKSGSVRLLPMFTFEELYTSNPSTQNKDVADVTYELDSTALLLHSSGSTDFPKLIKLTHRNLLEWGRGAQGEMDLDGEVLGGQALAYFHAMGVIAPLWCATVGMTLAVFAPKNPPVRPTPENLFNDLRASESTLVFCVPSHLEAWANNPETWQHLAKSLKAVVFCGAPLAQQAGLTLTSKGVNIQPYFASTETGGMSLFLPESKLSPHQDSWNMFQLAPHCNVRISDARLADGTDEGVALVQAFFLQGPTHTPSAFNATLEGKPAYTTGDLLCRSKINGKEYFSVYGREDDQINMSTGEKTNPLPIEKTLAECEYVEHIVLFGHGKPQIGALVQATPKFYTDTRQKLGTLPQDELLAHLRRAIAPYLRIANEQAPAHSKIFPEMIMLCDRDTPFSLTGKQTVRRRHVLTENSRLIEAAYLEVEKSALLDIPGPKAEQWTIAVTTQFVEQVISRHIGSIRPAADIFEQGADSLHATSIRNALLRALRDVGARTSNVPSDVVFQIPTVDGLSAFLFGAGLHRRTGSTENDGDPEEMTPWPALGKAGETMVRLRQGENPLILIHGAGGTIHAFPPLREKFRSGLVAIQVTPDTPMESLGALIDFYYGKIRDFQPQGPYRLAAFSATSILAVALAKKFEAGGDRVAQVALIDHVPTFYLCPVYGLENMVLESSLDRKAFHEVCCEGICDLLRRDGGGKIARRHQLAKELKDAFEGRPAPEFSTTYWRTVERFLDLMVDFMLCGHMDSAEYELENRPLEAFMRWQSSLAAPVSVYIASEGMKRTIPKHMQEEWKDLGAMLCWPNAKFHHIEGGHFDILSHMDLIEKLQSDWI
ncbi:acetyl-CoA synthetase-like protein [Tilletiaria anomala UBC 951]|uniref:Acetyl-CoA synthetase-like protein n=1 Tax=Tilletiaria anomala (strain ATCC 24038 / CBS 436.72 / UBC 951) TaxID=1037660 RepID=A0A066V2S3_TILAU|nr:acetyl-CoA synthetase-like protein [Tilletiaria anomala UBC 951]KDN35741.1 acetyl-CoA synthetase-like protein [Tilletiaria anomala UBC 951]